MKTGSQWFFLLFGLILQAFSPSLSSPTSPGDQSALINFWNGLEEKGQIQEWNTTDGLCGQIGIGCRGDRVISLFLLLTDIKGTLSPELGKLSALEELWLQENFLYGTVPKEFGSLQRLTHLFLSFNEITDYPTELGDLRMLSELYLNKNKLKGTLHTELGQLHNLRYLHLSENELVGPIPTQLGNLALLTNLDLSVNKLIGTIPSELRGIERLYYLMLNDNHLTGTVPSGLSDLPLATLTVGGTNHYCPIVDYSKWATEETDFSSDGKDCLACTEFTCANEGVCVGGVNELFRCECPKGFSGSNCEKKAGEEGPLMSGAGIAVVVIGLLIVVGLAAGGIYYFVTRRRGGGGRNPASGGSEGGNALGGWHPLRQQEQDDDADYQQKQDED